ncbi:hypothetical protein [Pseudonocardia oroxyli]|uniref:hypothetical protein n=1 Tax=Pseudonocardia oroxyli TaxID=366584 RepID=UPI0015A24DFB|nr:hypothetical protein [Pseudonocardia oroxyli]
MIVFGPGSCSPPPVVPATPRSRPTAAPFDWTFTRHDLRVLRNRINPHQQSDTLTFAA